MSLQIIPEEKRYTCDRCGKTPCFSGSLPGINGLYAMINFATIDSRNFVCGNTIDTSLKSLHLCRECTCAFAIFLDEAGSKVRRFNIPDTYYKNAGLDKLKKL